MLGNLRTEPTITADARRRRQIINRMAVVYWAYAVVLAFAIPEDVLSSSEATNEFVLGMGRIFTNIEYFRYYSTFPEVTAFFFSAMWSTSPILLVAWFLILRKADVPAVPALQGLTTILVCIVSSSYGMFRLNPQTNTMSGLFYPLQLLLSQSRLGMAVVGAAFVFGSVLVLSVVPFLLIKGMFTQHNQ